MLVNCQDAPDEAVPLVKSRFDDFLDGKLIITNIVYNFPYAVDTAQDVWNFLTTPETTNYFDGHYDAGFGVGRLVYYVLADNELAVSRDPAEGMDLPGYVPPEELVPELPDDIVIEGEEGSSADGEGNDIVIENEVDSSTDGEGGETIEETESLIDDIDTILPEITE